MRTLLYQPMSSTMLSELSTTRNKQLTVRSRNRFLATWRPSRHGSPADRGLSHVLDRDLET